MHHVDRGPEPEGLERVRKRSTPRWVAFYRNGEGTRPSDAHWRRFADTLGRAFQGLCAYCKRNCKGEVDHFRPKSRFPEIVYEWANWVFSCHDCNHAKGEKWPEGGYIAPCDPSDSARPERFFRFDTVTGEILPASGLTPAETHRARLMIRDLDLNGFHHLKSRLIWLAVLRGALDTVGPHSDERAKLMHLAGSRDTSFSSIARELFAQLERL